jgi:hypothetical protein
MSSKQFTIPSDHGRNFCVSWNDTTNEREDNTCDNPNQSKGVGFPNNNKLRASLGLVQSLMYY